MPTGVHSSSRTTPLTKEMHRMRGTQIRVKTDLAEPFYEKTCPEPPIELNADAIEEWDRLAPLLHAQGMLTEVDRASLGVYCQAVADWRSITRTLNAMRARDKGMEGNVIKSANGTMIVNPLVKVARDAQNRVIQMAVEFGLTPVSRQRLKARVLEKPVNPFDANGDADDI